jgi:PAS domain S-box-containing protein
MVLPSVLTPKNRRLPFLLITLLTLASLMISVISLVSGWLTIFQNLFYFPIILACVYYVKRGFVFSVILACSYFFLMLIFSQDPVVLQGAVIRVLIFILVAWVITYLSVVRIRAEDALRESEEFNRGLVENMPNLVIVYDHDRKIRYVNPTTTTFLGYSTEEMLGTDIITYVVPHQHAEIAAAMQERFSSGGGKSLEIDLITKGGQHLTVISTGAPLHFHNQPAVLILLADISDRKRAEDALKQAHDELEQRVAERTEELQQANEDLRAEITERKQAEEASEKAEAQLRQSQKMEAIGELAGGVAHDFNNLLTGILGNIALMRGSLPPADPLLENLNAAETAARQAADLTKGLLTFSRSAMVLPVPIKITAALDATLALLKQSLPATMEIVRDYDQTAWNVLVDQSQMTQILLNLAVNARDAMKGKGTLTIRARNEVVGEEYLQTHPFARTGEFVHLSVTDTGPGMSSEVMQHLFEPFYTTKPIGSGTGLGLSVVYGAVKQAGGWITAASTEGAGATFDIYLPRCLEEPAQSFTSSPLSVNVRGGTVLVVEDEPVVRTVTQALLSRSGYTVLTAPDGASALNVLRDHPVGIGLILLDMTMPGMTTGEIVRAIRSLEPTVPILLSSGYTSNGAIRYMLEEGSVQGFLGKPYDLDQLLDKVQELLHRG